MRRCLIAGMVILLCVAVVGGVSESHVAALSRNYADRLLPLGLALQGGRWQEALRLSETLCDQWQRDAAWVQLLLNHADLDAVTYSLRSLVTSVSERSRLSSLLAFEECRENFAHLHHRDAFTLKNIL